MVQNHIILYNVAIIVANHGILTEQESNMGELGRTGVTLRAEPLVEDEMKRLR